jgi:hypothetical protein
MTKMHRHTFLVAAGITALAHGQAIPAPSKSSSIPLQLTGNGNGRTRSYPDGEHCPPEQHSEARMGDSTRYSRNIYVSTLAYMYSSLSFTPTQTVAGPRQFCIVSMQMESMGITHTPIPSWTRLETFTKRLTMAAAEAALGGIFLTHIDD